MKTSTWSVSSLLRSSLLLAILTGWTSPLASDVLHIEVGTDERPFALAAGPLAGGVCFTGVFAGKQEGIPLPDFGGDSDKCKYRLTIFALGGRVQRFGCGNPSKSGKCWKGQDFFKLALDDQINLRVKVWILSKREPSDRARLAFQVPNMIVAEAKRHLGFTRYVLDRNYTGLDLEDPPSIKDVSNNQDQVDKALVKGSNPCGDDQREAWIKNRLFDPKAAINVYYGGPDRISADKHCGGDGLPSLIYIRTGAPVDKLAHEIGHALGLKDLDSKENPHNMMVQGTRFRRCHFGFDEVYDMNVAARRLKFGLEAAELWAEDGPWCGPGKDIHCPSKTADLALTRGLPPCPQMAIGGVIDWVACKDPSTCIQLEDIVSKNDPLTVVESLRAALLAGPEIRVVRTLDNPTLATDGLHSDSRALDFRVTEFEREKKRAVAGLRQLGVQCAEALNASDKTSWCRNEGLLDGIRVALRDGALENERPVVAAITLGPCVHIECEVTEALKAINAIRAEFPSP